MGLPKIKCPECNAGLKSAAGFTVGQTVCCPKCETYFTVEEPEDDFEAPRPAAKSKGAPAGKKPVRAAAVNDDEDDEDEKPRKKKRRVDDEGDDERAYKNSPVRFVILGVLIVVMLVLAYFLYEKKRKESEAAANPGSSKPVEVADRQKEFIGPQNFAPQNGPVPQAVPNPQNGPKRPAPVAGVGAGVTNPFGVPTSVAQVQALTQKYTTALLGSWIADLGDGTTEELTYKADGTFSAKQTGPSAQAVAGKYAVKSVVGTKVLKIELNTDTGPRTITVTFEGKELEHPSLQPGVTATFRKK